MLWPTLYECDGLAVVINPASVLYLRAGTHGASGCTWVYLRDQCILSVHGALPAVAAALAGLEAIGPAPGAREYNCSVRRPGRVSWSGNSQRRLKFARL